MPAGSAGSATAATRLSLSQERSPRDAAGRAGPITEAQCVGFVLPSRDVSRPSVPAHPDATSSTSSWRTASCSASPWQRRPTKVGRPESPLSPRTRGHLRRGAKSTRRSGSGRPFADASPGPDVAFDMEMRWTLERARCWADRFVAMRWPASAAGRPNLQRQLESTSLPCRSLS